MPTLTVPWAPQGTGLEYRPIQSRIPELLMRQGEIEAQRAQQSGMVWANLAQSLAQIGQSYLDPRRKAQAEEDKAQAVERAARTKQIETETRAKESQITRQKALTEAVQSGKSRDRVLASFEGDPAGYNELVKHYQQIDDSRNLMFGNYAEAVKRRGDTPEAAAAAFADLIDQGWDPKRLEEIRPQLQDQASIGKFTSALLKASPNARHQKLGEEAKLIEVSPNASLYNPATKATEYTAPGPAPKPENLTTEEAFIREKYGDKPTAAQRLAGRAAWEAAGRKPEKTPEGLPAPQQRRVYQLQDKFAADPIVKRANTIAEGYSYVSSLDPKTANPQDDQGLIYAFAKAMDPDSAVREGEYATVQKYAQSWLDKFGFDAKRVVSNTAFLTPEARKNIKDAIGAKFEASRKSYENTRAEYGKQIDHTTGSNDGLTYLLDYGAGFPKKSDGKYVIEELK